MHLPYKREISNPVLSFQTGKEAEKQDWLQ